METRNRKNRSISTIILLILLLFSFGALYYFYSSYQKDLNSINVLKAEENRLKEEIALKDKNINDLNGDINFSLDLKNQAIQIKEEFFNKASELENKIINNESDARIAYLTFDDGPYLATSMNFLDFLDQEDIKATFFYLAKGEETYPIYQRIIDSGHTLANHSATHRLKKEISIYRSVDIFKADVLENKEFVQDNFAYTTNIFRFPGGSPTAGAIKNDCINALRDMGYGYVDWDITTGDGSNSGTVEEYIHGVIDNYQPYNVVVVLMHDYSVNTLSALPTIVETLRNDGFIFLPLFYDSYKIIK